MQSLQGFAPIAQQNAKILILGSMPSEKSLEEHQYYAHPRNAFWKIIAQLFDSSVDDCYAKRTEILLTHQIGLWDVIKNCEREGSLDSNIKNNSITHNDFEIFFQTHSQIQHIFFNGSRAEKEYRQRVFSSLSLEFQKIPTTRLPSTSPAMASLSFEQKLASWKQIKQKL